MARGGFCWLRIPDYPVWAWQQLEPALRDQELIIDRGGRVLTSTPALQEFGVAPGMATERALALTHLAQPLVRPEPGEQGQFLWEEVLAKVYCHTPRLENHRPGCVLAELEVSQAEVLALSVPACAGLAYDRNTAYLASLVASPGSLRGVERGREKAFRDRLSCLCLLQGGVSLEAVQRLIWLGFPSVGSLMRLTPEQLRSRFGEAESLLFFSTCADATRVSLYRPPEILSASHVFDPPLREPVLVPEVLAALLKELSSQLGERVAAWVGCRCEDERGGERQMRRLLKQPTALSGKFAHLCKSCWESIHRQPSGELEKWTLELGGLKRRAFTQTTLFEERSPWSTFLPTFQARFPGKLLRVETLLEGAYLPEESFTLRELSSAPARAKARKRR